MYLEYFNLDTLPFENTPDARFFYASEQHNEALAAIEYTIRMRKGYVLITGDIGSGKTTVSRAVCERCSDEAHVVPVLHGHASPSEMLRQILRTLNTRFRRDDEHARLLDRLRVRLEAHSAEQKPVVLLVDEAQTLSDSALEELRLLSNFDTATQKIVQVVLVGQPELRMRLRAATFDALRQRIVLAKQLQPLSIEDTASYLAHRISAASIDPDQPGVVFEPQAIREMHRFTGGTPRLINFTADNCLLLGYVRQLNRITAQMVRRVTVDMLPSFDEPLKLAARPSPRLSLAKDAA